MEKGSAMRKVIKATVEKKVTIAEVAKTRAFVAAALTAITAWFRPMPRRSAVGSEISRLSAFPSARDFPNLTDPFYRLMEVIGVYGDSLRRWPMKCSATDYERHRLYLDMEKVTGPGEARCKITLNGKWLSTKRSNSVNHNAAETALGEGGHHEHE